MSDEVTHAQFIMGLLYRRLQRFITRLSIPQEKLAAFVLNLIPGPYLLALDRTNWAFGKTPINFLVLSVVWHGQGIPFFWKLLPHKGCSALADRMALIEAFLKLKSAGNIQGLNDGPRIWGPGMAGCLG